MRKIIASIICSFVPGRTRRRRIRVRLQHPIIKKMAKFAKSFSTNKHPKVRYTYGFRTANFVVVIDDKWVFKFPLTGDAHDIAVREKRITDALRPISPVKIPDMEILDWNGMAVRRQKLMTKWPNNWQTVYM